MTMLFAFPEQVPLARQLKAEQGNWEWRHFPDGESYVRVTSDVRGKPVTILCSLNQPDEKILPLLFLARTLKELGARGITLIAPYLGYMRQDTRFKSGEAISSDLFAALLSPVIDALVTIDPHLHRHARLEEIYRCQCTTISAAPLITQWIRGQVHMPVLIGPDEESAQWVKAVAEAVQAPYVVLQKKRQGDREVEIVLPDMATHRGRTPVIIDDIVSTAGTMMKTVALLREHRFPSVTCLAVHGLFAGDSYSTLIGSGAAVVTTNTVPHASNALDIAPLVAAYAS